MDTVIGIDEVGRGCWAGPLLVVAARARGSLPQGLADSKNLSKVQRTRLYPKIQQSCNLGEGWVSPKEIDQKGLTAAMRLGVARALRALGADRQDAIIMDGNINYCPKIFSNVQTIVAADSSHPIVSAASVYAKVTRDTYMVGLAQKFPDYGFEHHVGYGTKAHLLAIKDLGICRAHRQSYKPIQALA